MIEPGAILGGKLRIERILGQGGMGVVAVAMHLQLEQRVAVKVLRDQLANDAGNVERFMREARAAARLRSEHVCRVQDVGELDDGGWYIVMELLDGRDLASLGVLPVATAVDYVLQASIALAEAHALGIVHRDLKPANLFLTRRLDGTPLVKVLDFGIVKTAAPVGAALTETNALMGSPGYMSPEQLRSARAVDARADVWALGVILYQLVSGRLPFSATSITEMSVKIAMDPPEPLGVDPAFDAVVLRCLEKLPDQRYPDVAALATDLARFAGPSAATQVALIAQLLRASPDAFAATRPQLASPQLPSTTLQGATGVAVSKRGTSARRDRWLGGAIGGAGVAAIAIVIVVVAASHSSAPEPPPPIIAAVPAVPLVPPIATPPIDAPPPIAIDAAVAPPPPVDAAPEVVHRGFAPGKTHAPPAPATIDPEWWRPANEDMLAGEYAHALMLSERVLAIDPDDSQANRMGAAAACYLEDAVKAKKYGAKLGDKARSDLNRTICERFHIEI